MDWVMPHSFVYFCMISMNVCQQDFLLYLHLKGQVDSPEQAVWFTV